MITAKDRLLKYSEQITESGCWVWMGVASKNKNGSEYGRIWYRGRYEGAHRVSYIEFVGNVQPGYYVLHQCDVACCINPAHLFLGTQSDNLRDCVKKGRYKSPATKITYEHVVEIRGRRKSGETYASIAEDFSVSPQAIYYRCKL